MIFSESGPHPGSSPGQAFFGIMRYCLLPVVSPPPPFAVDWLDGLLPPSFDDPVNIVRLGSDDRWRLLITHRPASATQPAIKMAGSVTTSAPRKLANAANTCMPATQSCLAAMYKA